MGEHIHKQVLEAATQIAQERSDWTFNVDEVLRMLPHLNVSSVRTHVVSRCCVNAPKNHVHKWDYFRRVGRGVYQVIPSCRAIGRGKPRMNTKKQPDAVSSSLRDTVHVLVSRDRDAYVAECIEIAVVTQGRTLDELVQNVREAVALHLEDEEPGALGLERSPRLQLLYDLPRAI